MTLNKVGMTLAKYVLGTVSVAFVCGASFLLSSQLSGHYLFLFLTAVVLSSLYGGFGVGIWTSILSAVCHNYFFQFPKHTFFVSSFNDWLELTLFVGVSLIVSWVGASIRNSRREAELAIKAREDILAIVAHDLKNPLAAILLNVEILEKYRPKDISAESWAKVEPRFKSIKQSAAIANNLIRDLLDLAKVESGSTMKESVPTDMGRLVSGVVESLKPLAEHKHITFEAIIQNTSQKYICDGHRISQAVANLIGNAIKFTPEGGRITVRANRLEGDFHFSVEDSGPGILEEDISHIFERFWQSKETQKMGTGLGLSIVKSVVEKHRGKLWVESTIGQGSKFHFTLPAPKTVVGRIQSQISSQI